MTVREPRFLVETCIRWHLAVGAKEVHVYFDDPDDPAYEPISAIAGVRAVRCDQAHWAELRGKRGRPPSQMRRQSLNATQANALCDADWLVHLDADEFLWQDRPLSEELAFVAELGSELRFPVLERVWHAGAAQQDLFAGPFQRRSPSGKYLDKEVFGERAQYLRDGLFSHATGKCAIPARLGLMHGVHECYRNDGGKRQRLLVFHSNSTRLLHFDGLTRLHWLLKFVRYKLTPPDVQAQILPDHRAAQIDTVLGQSDDLPAGLRAHDDIRGVTPEALDRLRGLGLIEELPFDPRATIADLPDQTPAAFDATLREREAELMALCGWEAE